MSIENEITQKIAMEVGKKIDIDTEAIAKKLKPKIEKAIVQAFIASIEDGDFIFEYIMDGLNLSKIGRDIGNKLKITF
jgi:hypothetical protein